MLVFLWRVNRFLLALLIVSPSLVNSKSSSNPSNLVFLQVISDSSIRLFLNRFVSISFQRPPSKFYMSGDVVLGNLRGSRRSLSQSFFFLIQIAKIIETQPAYSVIVIDMNQQKTKKLVLLPPLISLSASSLSGSRNASSIINRIPVKICELAIAIVAYTIEGLRELYLLLKFLRRFTISIPRVMNPMLIMGKTIAKNISTEGSKKSNFSSRQVFEVGLRLRIQVKDCPAITRNTRSKKTS